MLLLPLLTAALPLAVAAPHAARDNGGSTATPTSSAPQVTITPAGTNGRGVVVNGVSQKQLGQDVYLGIPFAAPPVGDLRFTAPQDPVYNSTLSAVKQPPACLQNPSNNATYGMYGYSEDCLYLNVYTPAGANAQTAWLPVMVWVYGGGFTSGSANFYNASALMYQGLATQRPFIFVALNYRLGVLGWPYGAEVAKNNAANLGLKDVRKALSWVQDNIWAFGGNPDQVTVFGQSAGAIATSLLYLQQDSSSLFSGAIMESGAMSVSPIGPTATTWNNAYNDLVKLAGCTNSTSGSFACLKALPAAQLIQAQVAITSSVQYGGAFPFAPSIDGDLIPDSPHKLISEGKFQQIPFISGNNKDEGTIFVPRSVTSEALVPVAVDLFEPKPLDNQTLAELFQYYPNDPALGSPFGTGNETFGVSPVFKQLAAILGDATFQAGRRWFLQNAGQIYPNLPTWSYFYNQTYPGAPAYLGVYHGSEVFYVFGAPLLGASPYGNFTAGDAVVSKTMIDYWVNFAYYRDPSPASSPVANQTAWPQYNFANGKKNMLKIQYGNTTVIQDDYREERIAFFNRNPQQFNLKRDVQA